MMLAAVDETQLSRRELRQLKKARDRVKIPQRPFQAPPQVVDCTKEAVFEHKWMPIDMCRNGDLDYDVKATHFYDRRNIDQGLFHLFEDQQLALRELDRSDLQEQIQWKRKEDDHAERARELHLKKEFMSLAPGPHDYFNIQPQSYNLSIQYDREKGKADREK